MKSSEVAKLLAMASAFDNRSVGEANVSAWAAALAPDMPFPDAAEAVRQHFATTSDYLMPVHVNAYVRQLRRLRVSACQTVPEIPPDLHQAQERDWLHWFWNAVKAADADPNSVADRHLRIVRSTEQLTPRPDRIKVITALANAKGVA